MAARFGYRRTATATTKLTHSIFVTLLVGSFTESLKSFFLGARPQLKNDSLISYTKGEGRFGLKTVGSGVVYVHLELICSGFSQYGICLE